MTVDTGRMGILLDDGTMHWAAISSGGTTNTITIDAGLASAASSGNLVYFYTAKSNRPRRIDGAVITKKPSTAIGDASETRVEIIQRMDYFELTNKGADGQVNQIYYDAQRVTGELYVWPQSSLSTDYLKLWVQRSIEDWDAADALEDADFPQDFFEALSTNLAKRLIPKYGVSSEVYGQIRELASMALFDAESGDTETEYRFQPSGHGR